MMMAPPCSTIYHAQRKRFRWKRVFAFTGRFTALAVRIGLVAGLVWGVSLLYPLVLGAAYFQVKHIQMDGLQALSEHHVRYLLDIPQGRTLWQLDLMRIGARLERHPYIKTVTLRRDFPDTLLVTVQERVPRLAIQTPQQAVVIDNDAVVMRAWQPEEDVKLLQLNLPHGRHMEPGMRLHAAEVHRALELLTAYHASPVAEIMHPLSFTVQPSGASMWKFESYAFTVYFGEGRIDTQLGRLPLVLRYITQQGLAVRSVDLSYRKRVMITPVT
jgi:hypothetical protein